MLLDALQWTGRPPTSKNYLIPNVSERRGGEALGYEEPSSEGVYRAWCRVCAQTCALLSLLSLPHAAVHSMVSTHPGTQSPRVTVH